MNNNKIFFAYNVKNFRISKGLSQQSLADKIGVDRSTISRIENGEIETTIDNAIKIADTLNVSVEDLIRKDLTTQKIFFASNLKFLRTDKHKTQKEIAAICGKKNSVVNNWEKGIREPNLNDLVKLASFFDEKIDDFLLKDLRRETN